MRFLRWDVCKFKKKKFWLPVSLTEEMIKWLRSAQGDTQGQQTLFCISSTIPKKTTPTHVSPSWDTCPTPLFDLICNPWTLMSLTFTQNPKFWMSTPSFAANLSHLPVSVQSPVIRACSVLTGFEDISYTAFCTKDTFHWNNSSTRCVMRVHIVIPLPGTLYLRQTRLQHMSVFRRGAVPSRRCLNMVFPSPLS